MKDVFVIIGLIFELWGVLFLLSPNLRKKDIQPLCKILALNSMFFAIIVGMFFTFVSLIILILFENYKYWALAFFAVVWLPTIVCYIKDYCRDTELSDLKKIQQISLKGFLLLATGFILQSIGAILD